MSRLATFQALELPLDRSDLGCASQEAWGRVLKGQVAPFAEWELTPYAVLGTRTRFHSQRVGRELGGVSVLLASLCVR